MGLINVNISNGLQDEPFYGGREIIEEIIPGRKKPYFYDIRESPLSFNVAFAFEEVWNYDKMREVARWLIKDNYKELYFDDNVDKRYYAVVVDNPRLIHNCLKQGYVELTFRCNAPYAFSPIYTSQYDLSGISSPTIITFNNEGDDILKPEIEILKYGTGDFSITNLTDGGKVCSFTGLADQETVYVNNELRQIISDSGFYRYDNHNGNYLELVRGENSLEVNGAAIIDFRYQYILK
jgi:phage-related protein